MQVLQWLHLSLSARSAVLVLSSLLLLLLGDVAALATHYPSGTREDLLFHSALLPALWLAVSHMFRLRTGTQAATCGCILLLHWVMVAAWGLLEGINPLAALQVAAVLLFIAALTVYNTYNVELNARRVLLLVMASRRAKRQADNVMGQLLPVSVNTALSNNESIPFQILPHDVVILWADLVGFTALSAKMDSLGVLRMLHNIFVQFDALVEASALWKLDTIGDAYVVIGGLQEDTDGPSLVERQFALALSMQRIVSDISKHTNGEIGIRIGVHAGPVATGIIGTLRPRFYVFGRTVLEAEHMEATGQAGRVQVSPAAATMYRRRTYGLHARSQPPPFMFASGNDERGEEGIRSTWLQPLGSQITALPPPPPPQLGDTSY
jgi:class 3 adenylate cyclase